MKHNRHGGMATRLTKAQTDGITHAAVQFMADLEALLPLIIDLERDAAEKRTKRRRLKSKDEPAR